MHTAPSPSRTIKMSKPPIITALLSAFPNACEQVALAAQFGAAKYNQSPDSMVAGLTAKDHLDALGRHLVCWFRGEQHDFESELHPLAHAAWRALAALEAEVNPN
jgi:hypothetical protein